MKLKHSANKSVSPYKIYFIVKEECCGYIKNGEELAMYIPDKTIYYGMDIMNYCPNCGKKTVVD